MAFNYRLPEQSCRNCQFAYRSSYGDSQCTRQIGFVVDRGGICDVYDCSVNENLKAPTVTTPLPVEEKCGECAYKQGEACMLTGKYATRKCASYYKQRQEAAPALPRAEGTCATCLHSAYVNNEAYCNVLNKNIRAEDVCAVFCAA